MKPLLALLAKPTTRLLVVVAALAAAARVSVIATAREAGRGELARIVALGVAMGILFALQRLVQARARVRVEVDLLRAAAHALVSGDVLGATERDFQRSVFESESHARALVSSNLPVLAGDVLVSFVALGILSLELPLRVLVVAALALGLVLGVTLVLRRSTQKLQAGVLHTLQHAYDRLLVAIEGRIEIVARGGEDRFEAALAESLSSYARVADRAGVRSALLGRAPLVVGGTFVLAAMFVDGASRHAMASTMVADALLLASCLPPPVGVIVGVNDAARLRAAAAPFVTLVQRPSRPDRAAAGAPTPTMPFELAMEDVSFRYHPGAPDVLSGANERLRVGSALFVEGPNGRGKSTFLRVLLGLHLPTGGKVTVSGVDLRLLDLSAFRRHVAYLPQAPYLGEPYMTVRTALAMFSDANDDLLRDALARVAIATSLDAPIGALSAGQRQRVALARVLLQNATIVVLDEPDAYLDTAGVALVARIIADLVAADKLVAVAAHSPELAIAGAVRVNLGRA